MVEIHIKNRSDLRQRRLNRIRKIQRQRNILLGCIVLAMFGLSTGMLVSEKMAYKTPAIMAQENKERQKEVSLVCGLVLEQEKEVLSGHKSWMRVLLNTEEQIRRNASQYREAGYQVPYLLYVVRDLRQYAMVREYKKNDFGLLVRGYSKNNQMLADRNRWSQKNRITGKRYIDMGHRLLEQELQNRR